MVATIRYEIECTCDLCGSRAKSNAYIRFSDVEREFGYAREGWAEDGWTINEDGECACPWCNHAPGYDSTDVEPSTIDVSQGVE